MLITSSLVSNIAPWCTVGVAIRSTVPAYFRDSGFGIRDSGFGIRDSGFEIRDPQIATTTAVGDRRRACGPGSSLSSLLVTKIRVATAFFTRRFQAKLRYRPVPTEAGPTNVERKGREARKASG